ALTRARLPHMPANAGRIDDVNLAAPWKISRLTKFHAFVPRRKPFAGDFGPVAIEIVDLDGYHLILLPIRDIDLLQNEVGIPEAQPRQTALQPDLVETQFGKKFDRAMKIRTRRNERIEASALGLHAAVSDVRDYSLPRPRRYRSSSATQARGLPIRWSTRDT